jgi:DNA modification methylase
MVLTTQKIKLLAKSVLDKRPVSGLTHNFYRYPARFSPSFASTAIQLFSKYGDLILDPYMGGGTTVIEAMVAGRRIIGADLNSLAVFVTRVKTTALTKKERKEVISWNETYPTQFSYQNTSKKLDKVLCEGDKIKNLTLPRAKFIKKIIATGLISLNSIESQKVKDFLRCAILKTGQWALDGRRTHTSLTEFREKLSQNIYQMLEELRDFQRLIYKQKPGKPRRKLIEANASQIDKIPMFSKRKLKADLVITSPPYPGIHILYHRWQVDGRRETPAPYWIAGCQDGQGDSYYNFGSRQQPELRSYFDTSLRTLKAIRNVIRDGGYIVQMMAFKDPIDHLRRYLENMKTAGFDEVVFGNSYVAQENSRIWRNVPNRKWHASLRGNTSGSKEVVLIHVAN